MAELKMYQAGCPTCSKGRQNFNRLRRMLASKPVHLTVYDTRIDVPARKEMHDMLRLIGQPADSGQSLLVNEGGTVMLLSEATPDSLKVFCGY